MLLTNLVHIVEDYLVYSILAGFGVSQVLLIIVFVLFSRNKKLAQRLAKLESANLAMKSVENLDLQNLDLHLSRLEQKHSSALRHVAMVRFNAFDDSGSGLSYALAVLNDDGDGFLISSLFTREESRTYAKQIVGGKPSHPLSPEEEEALKQALGR